MKGKSYFLLLFLTYLVNSCTCSRAPSDFPQIVDIDVPRRLDSLLSPRELLTSVEYIALGSLGDFFLTEAKKILELDNKLFILDKNKRVVVAYDLQGNLLGQVGKKGRGPEEYQTAFDFIVNPKTNSIVIFSSADQAFLEFGSDLSFRKKVRIGSWASHMSLLESGNFAFYTYFGQSGSNISIYSPEGKLVGKKMPYPDDGQYTPMDYTGFIVGNYYTYPLSAKIYRIMEGQRHDPNVFEINFPGRRQEELKFEHTQFLEPRNWMKDQILSKYSIGGEADELLFYYSYKEAGLSGFSLGVRLSSGQAFGHLHLKHGSKGNSDPFVRLFFLGPYNLPTYSQTSGYYYIATTIESIDDFHSGDKESAIEEIRKIDPKLYRLLSDSIEAENPIVMRFKLRRTL